MSTLCTFSGRFGDILWSLPTAQSISEKNKEPTDFGIMPAYDSLLPLLASQPYISKAFAIDAWECTGSPHGDQPWEAPVAGIADRYDRIYHLTYRAHPHLFPLPVHCAQQQGIFWSKPPIPFIHVAEEKYEQFAVSFSFNQNILELKRDVLEILQQEFPYRWVDVSKLSWVDAAHEIARCHVHLGCRSSNWVLATGLGANLLTYEPDPNRRPLVFTQPWYPDRMGPVDSLDWYVEQMKADYERFISNDR